MRSAVCDLRSLDSFREYYDLTYNYLVYLATEKPTLIISPTNPNYRFFQYAERFGHKITRPLNFDLYESRARNFKSNYDRFEDVIAVLRKRKRPLDLESRAGRFAVAGGIDSVVYTIQQSIGAIADSLDDSNQARKRVGQLFEKLVKLLLKEIGVECESRTVRLPIPGNPGRTMSYELDLVFSRDKAIVTAESPYLHPTEIVGSVKTTSKDRIDKIFLDKFLLTRLLGRDVPVIAIFLHDVQRARKAGSNFGIASTFKSNHFMGYSIALNKLDGVYYVDPRPDMATNELLASQISPFSSLLIRDLWVLTA